MRVLAIVLLVTMGCSLVYPAPNADKISKRQVEFSIFKANLGRDAPASILDNARPQLDALIGSSAMLAENLPLPFMDNPLLGGFRDIVSGLAPSKPAAKTS